MSIQGIGLYKNAECTLAVTESGGKFVLDTTDVYDFGRTVQLWVKNMNVDRNLKSIYAFITYDGTDSTFGTRYCSLSKADGTGITQDKLYLTNTDMSPMDNPEMFQILFSPELGVTNTSGLLLKIQITNHVVNSPQYQIV